VSARGWTAAALALAVPAASAAPDSWVAFDRIGREADGTWRSIGYGHVLAIRDGRARLFHVAGRDCYPDPGGAPGEAQDFDVARIDGPDRLTLAAAPEGTHYAFRRIAGLPTGCDVVRGRSPGEVAGVVAATFAELYPGFGVRGRNRGRFLRALTGRPPATEAALFARISQALTGLDDAHVGLTATIAGETRTIESGEAATLVRAGRDPRLGADLDARRRAWGRDYRAGLAALLDGGGHQAADRRVIWGRIGRIGYLNILTMGGFDPDAADDDPAALDAALDAVIADFRDLPGVIVDVTNNRGGYDSIALRIAGRFANARRRAFAKRPVGGDVPPQAFDVIPSTRARYLGPVTLVTSDVTVSAGEVFVLAMRALPQVRHLGAATRGALSDQLVKPLPNGWTLTLPAERYTDPAGRSAEGIGIVPARPSPPFAPDHRSAMAAIARAMESGAR